MWGALRQCQVGGQISYVSFTEATETTDCLWRLSGTDQRASHHGRRVGVQQHRCLVGTEVWGGSQVLQGTALSASGLSRVGSTPARSVTTLPEPTRGSSLCPGEVQMPLLSKSWKSLPELPIPLPSTCYYLLEIISSDSGRPFLGAEVGRPTKLPTNCRAPGAQSWHPGATLLPWSVGRHLTDCA